MLQKQNNAVNKAVYKLSYCLIKQQTHTYIIGHYNPWLLSPLILCALILYISSGTQSLKSEATDFWESFSWQVLFFLNDLPEICWEEIAEVIFFFFLFGVDFKTVGPGTYV